MTIDVAFKAISDPTRRKILDLLKEKSLTAGEIAEKCNSTKPNMSQHLNYLEKANLIEKKKVGQYVHYFLSKTTNNWTILNEEVRGLISIKEKLLFEIQKIALENDCQLIKGPEADDEVTIYIMHQTETVIMFNMSFKLSSVAIEMIKPSLGILRVSYQNQQEIDSTLAHIGSLIVKSTHKLTLENHSDDRENLLKEIKNKVISDVSKRTYDMKLFLTNDQNIITKFKQIVIREMNRHEQLTDTEKQTLLNEIVSNTTGLGKIQILYDDPTVSEIMINAHNEIFIEKHHNGKVLKTDIELEDEDEVIRLAQKIANYIGRVVNQKNPIVDARLPNNDRVHIILPPVSVRGVCITVRKIKKDFMDIDDYIDRGTISPSMARFLQAATKARANIIVSGSTGSGKTTTLNIVSNFIPNNERIVTIEDSTELHLDNDHVVKLETRPSNSEGVEEINVTDLIKASYRLRPERIIVGELRDGSAFDLLQAMNTGHDGSMGTIHANSPELSLDRINNLLGYRGYDFSRETSYELISEAVDLIIHLSRLSDGRRIITHISNPTRYCREQEKIIVENIYEWKITGEENGKIIGEYIFKPENVKKNLLDKFERENIEVDFKDFE